MEVIQVLGRVWSWKSDMGSPGFLGNAPIIPSGYVKIAIENGDLYWI